MLASCVFLVACGDDPGAPPGGATAAGGDPFASAASVSVAVPETGRRYVRLSDASVVTPPDPSTSRDWDLALQGYEVFTNSGPSGAGEGAAFGPLTKQECAGDRAPVVPFLWADRTGGAFLDWYAYDGASHLVYSRQHVYGVRAGDRAWKVQVIGYYGDQHGAPTPALYGVRYAELGGGDGAARTVQVDGTAGGVSAAPGAASGCLDLATGAVAALTEGEAQASTGWHLCFRRDAIIVNGEAGGPGGVVAADLSPGDASTETLDRVKALTAEQQLARFDAVTREDVAAAAMRGDHVVSTFDREGWVDWTHGPPAPADAGWLVLDASGGNKSLVAFGAFEGSTASSPGTVALRIKPVRD
ncbi:MAG: HmuY family protein [Polyangiaceae bacterium]|nr:HmuY family protein [Polyangiaceae bacterium]